MGFAGKKEKNNCEKCQQYKMLYELTQQTFDLYRKLEIQMDSSEKSINNINTNTLINTYCPSESDSESESEDEMEYFPSDQIINTMKFFCAKITNAIQ